MIYGYLSKLLFTKKTVGFVEGGPTIGLGLASNYPSAYQLLSAFIYFFTGENLIYPRVTSLLITFLLILLLHHWSREFWKSKTYAYYSLILFLTLPFIIFFSRSASQYMYFTFQFSLACYFLRSFQKNKSKKYLYLSAISAGFAALSSYLGLLFLLLLPTILRKKNLTLPSF